MGVATILIIVCHSVPYGLAMPGWLATILQNGGIGVDIFLFLSGMGMHNSMKKHVSNGGKLFTWYYKRYIRIIVPCFLIITPLVIWNPWHGTFNIVNFILGISGFGAFWGLSNLWFVSSILVLYILTPVFHFFLTCDRKWWWLWGLCVFCLLCGHIEFIPAALRFCMPRWVSYLIGYTLADDIRRGKPASVWLYVVSPLLLYVVMFVCNHTVNTDFSLFWTQGIPIMTICALIIDKLHSTGLIGIFAFMGKISLESYVTNEYLLRALAVFSWTHIESPVYCGRWTFYIVGTALCILFSSFVNKISNNLIGKIS